MRQVVMFLLFIFFIRAEVAAQFTRFVISLKDKGGSSYTLSNPASYLSPRAIERRTRYGIAIDSSDLPIPSAYITQIQSISNITVLNQSKWLNAVSVLADNDAAVTAVEALPFVKEVKAVAARMNTGSRDRFSEEEIELIYPERRSKRQNKQAADFYNYGSNSFDEIHLHQGEFLHNVGLHGQGMQIAMLDGGYFSYTTLDAFDSINLNGQVLGTWDFVSRNSSVTEDNSHGMMCLSTIAANIPGQFIGKAPKASFYLFRTEDVSSEYPIEEFNWVAGAERADSSGADIISSSLGYGYEFDGSIADYPYSDLNGDITMAARAADLAAAKGMLVFNSAGNSGNDYWRRIITPADGDSVVAVGAVGTDGLVGSFSSYGPSADGRIKPDVASVGVGAMVQTSGNSIGAANGTSFACPNMAGLATCLWQGFPEFNNMRIVRALKEAGDSYTSPDDRKGYGIPDMKKAFTSLLLEYVSSGITLNQCNVEIKWKSKDVSGMKYLLEKMGPGETDFSSWMEYPVQVAETLTNHEYSAMDDLTGKAIGNYTYRIRQVLENSTTDPAEIVVGSLQAELSNNCPRQAGPVLKLVPNPSNSSTTTLVIDTPAAIDQLDIRVYDMNGKLLLRLNRSKGAGLFNVELPTGQLQSGIYLVRVADQEHTIGKTQLLKL